MKKLNTISFCALLLLSTGTAWAYTPQDCIGCHAEASSKSTRHIPVDQFKASVHGGEITCLDCHTQVVDESHRQTAGSGAVDCSQCHEQQNHHGLQGLDISPECFDCHTRHNILARDNPDSSVNPQLLPQTCKGCHPVESGRTDYLSWLPSLKISAHKKQDFSRDYSRSNCIGCHQGQAAHGETELIDEQDCHKCHASRQGHSRLLGFIHPRADVKKQPAVFAAAVIYQLVAVFLVIGGFVFSIRLFAGKSGKGKESVDRHL
jgi:hypothetical protein